jgi:hypothetical protein
MRPDNVAPLGPEHQDRRVGVSSRLQAGDEERGPRMAPCQTSGLPATCYPRLINAHRARFAGSRLVYPRDIPAGPRSGRSQPPGPPNHWK